MNTYKPLLRPASMVTLPRGIQWDFVAAPWDIAHNRPDLPRAPSRYGVIQTSRPLTPAECENFDLEPC